MEQNKETKVAIIGDSSTGTNAMLSAALASIDGAELIVFDDTTRAEQTFAITNPYYELPEIMNQVPLRGSHPPYKRSEAKIGRNAACPCGSGLKYKRCCAAPK